MSPQFRPERMPPAAARSIPAEALRLSVAPMMDWT